MEKKNAYKPVYQMGITVFVDRIVTQCMHLTQICTGNLHNLYIKAHVLQKRSDYIQPYFLVHFHLVQKYTFLGEAL